TMPVATAPPFLELLRKSGLVGEEVLRSLPTDRSPAELADRLLHKGLLTRFQIDRLLSGRYKGFFLGSYKVLGVLGQGGMGKVFLAEHTVMRRKAAVKVLAGQVAQETAALQRFQREARAAAALNHPNIVQVLDNGQLGTVHYIALEYVEGQTLDSIRKQSGPLPPAQAV